MTNDLDKSSIKYCLNKLKKKKTKERERDNCRKLILEKEEHRDKKEKNTEKKEIKEESLK